MLITFDHVAEHLGDVTPEEIRRCFKATDESTHQDFYLVENERGDLNEQGEIIEYKVTFDDEHGARCRCKSGEHGFHNVRHPSAVCKHVRWACAFELQDRQYRAEIAAREAIEEEARRQQETPFDEHIWLTQSGKQGRLIDLETERKARRCRVEVHQ